MNEENQRLHTLASPYMSRGSLYQLKILDKQQLQHRASMSNLPDQEELVNQLNAKKEQNNNLNEENKRLKTQLKQQERDMKSYEDLIQRMENNLNFNILANQGDEPLNRRTRSINFFRKSINYENKQEIEKLNQKVKELTENTKTKNLSKITEQYHQQQKQLEIRKDAILGLHLEIKKLKKQVSQFSRFQNVLQRPKLEKEVSEAETLQKDLKKMKQQIFADQLVIKISNRIIQQLRPNPLQITQITKQRSSSFSISNECQIETKRNIRSNSILQDNKNTKRNLQLIKSIEDKNIQLKQANNNQREEMQKLINKLTNQIQQQANENQQLSDNVQNNQKQLVGLTADIEIKNNLIINLQEMIQSKASQLIDQKLQIDKQNKEMQMQKENISQANQEIQVKNNEIEQLKQVIEMKEKNLEVFEKEQIILELQKNLEAKNTNLENQNKKISELTQNYDNSYQQIRNLNNEIKQKQNEIIGLKVELEVRQFREGQITLQVKSFSTNLIQNFQMQLKDSISDLYIRAVQEGIHKGSPLDCCFLVPSKNIRYAATEWNKKFQDKLIPSDYTDKTITVEFSQLR